MEILMVVTIIGMIAAIGVPVFLGAIQNSRDHVKEVNVAAVEAAKQQWAFENNKTNGTAVQWGDISNYMGSSTSCLSNLNVNGASITINPVGTKAAY